MFFNWLLLPVTCTHFEYRPTGQLRVLGTVLEIYPAGPYLSADLNPFMMSTSAGFSRALSPPIENSTVAHRSPPQQRCTMKSV